MKYETHARTHLVVHAVSALLSVSILATAGRAQTASQPRVQSAPTEHQATAIRAEAAPTIDGRDDDPVWRSAPPTSDFQEFAPVEGKAPRFRTEFRAVFDDRSLFIFVRAFDPHPDSIRTALTRRDVRGSADELRVMIDAYHDRRSGFGFAVNPVGVKRDFAMYDDGTEDIAWDGVWEVATRIDSAGWTAEYRIPFSQLRYVNQPTHVFGFSIWRDIERYKERTSWPIYRPSQPGMSSQMGVLTGIRDISPFRRQELVPYLVTKSTSVAREASPSAPGGWAREGDVSAGADMKIGITPGMTLDATVNPDFGQVEADPSVVNLTAFESFFNERRPFFLEGIGLYAFSQNNSAVNGSNEGLFYPRRIGRAPQLLGEYGDASSSNITPILGAAKVTGRLADGFNVGVLQAVTGRVRGSHSRTIEPRTSYSLVRAQQDLRRGETSVGAIVTNVRRDLDQWTDPFVRQNAVVVGADLRHRWSESGYEINAKVTGSSVRGSAASILRTQTNSVHLFQRPDHMHLDSTRASLGGNAQEISMAKLGGGLVRWLTSYERQSAGYEVNDLGYLRRANLQAWKSWVGLNWQRPTRFYRQLNGNFNYQSFWTADGLRIDHAVNTNWAAELADNSSAFGNLTASLPGSFCDNCARGGPAVRHSPNLSWDLGWQGDDRKLFVPSLRWSQNFGDRANANWRTHGTALEASVGVRPVPQLQMAAGVQWSRNTDDVQWIGNFDSPGGQVQYTFARLDQTTASLTTRVDAALTPALSFQFYGSPFWSGGAYGSPRRLSATPRADAYADRYTSVTLPAGVDSGFDVLQLRSTSVIRWEFRPGSTAFAVWTHGRDAYSGQERDRPGADVYHDLFALHPANTFLIKVAYWLDR